MQSIPNHRAIAFCDRIKSAEATLRAGYDPEKENGAAVRSDAWGRALGWQDAICEEVLEATDPQQGERTRRMARVQATHDASQEPR